MSSISYPMRISEQLMTLAELRSREEHVDKTAALKQLLYIGAEDYVMQLYRAGRVSLSRAAQLLDRNVHDVMLLVEKHGVKAGATVQQQLSSEKTVARL